MSSTSQREAVTASIRRAIATGTLRPGEKLREVALAAEIGVSRPTLREGLNGLVQAGLVSHQPHSGFAVAALDDATIRDLAETRVALDLLAVRAIWADNTGEATARLHAMWNDVSHRILDEDPLVQLEAHIAFHRGLWEASGNQMLARLWPVTESAMLIALAQDQALHRDPLRAYRIHRSLVGAIAAVDPAAVETLLVEHTVDSAEHVIAEGGARR
jgi:DNA-binding GntR family transcriptional regulator